MARDAAQDGMTLGAVHRSVKARIMAGEFPAGARLRPDALRGAYDVSASAMREVLLRLAVEGLVAQEEQRGFSVPTSDLALLGELMDLRVLLEGEGAVQSMRRGDMEWEAGLAAAHHKLAHIEARMRDAEDPAHLVPIWTRVDWEFHDALLSACPNRALREEHRAVYERFRQQVVAATPTAGFRHETIEEHEAILNAAVARDEDACRKAIRSHLWTYRDDMIGG
ncbi:GntR family transcriptional regulator [Rhodovulum sp. DZ06]|uniref:GntR family transcriptional regulator n=1 Tax=Rhodovulum sp. DZ06 TaxID=3425126 RepID=UPI003D32C40D